MNRFTYKNNGGKSLDGFPYVIESDNILKSDTIFKEKSGFDVVKCPWIGCSIEFNISNDYLTKLLSVIFYIRIYQSVADDIRNLLVAKKK